jgi:hypothetical protein
MLRHLILPLLAGLVALQVPLLLLARWLGRPLRWEVPALGFVLPLLLLLPWLDGSHLLAPTNQLLEALPGVERPPLPDPHRELNDVAYSMIPWELEVRHALAAGRLPFWSDLVDGGSSPWSNPQAQVLSPVAMLSRATPIQHSLLVLLALKLMVAFEGAWVLCRRVGAGRAAAAVGGGAFALGGGILGWALFPLSTAAAWAPWVVAAVVAVVRRPRAGTMAALAFATAALALAGHPEVAAGAVALAAFVGAWLRRRRSWRRGLLAAALAGALGAGLAAPHLAPFVVAARASMRAGERLSAAAPTRDLTAGVAGWFVERGGKIFKAPLSPLALGEPYGKEFRGPWAWPLALAAYTGLLALAGAAAALAGWRRRLAAPFLLAWAAALVGASRFVPIERLLFLVPPLRVPELSRMLPLGCLGLAVAAALGIEQLRRSRRRRSFAAAAIATAVLVPGTLLTPVGPAIALAAGTAAGTWLLALRRRPAGFALLAATLLLDLVPWGRPQLPAADPASFYPVTPTIARVQAEVEGGRWRAVAEDLLVYPALLPVYGIPDPRPHNPMAPREQLAVLARAFGFAPGNAQTNYFASFRNVEHPLLDFLNVRVVLSNPYLGEKHRLELIAGPDARTFLVYRNPRALPRWFVAPAAAAVARRDVLTWLSGNHDARRVALLAEETRGWLPAARRWEADAVTAHEARFGRVDLRVGGEGERLLATSLPGPRGWRARAGGGELETLTVNAAFVGVRVPAGVDRVELRYLPPGLLPGTVMGALAAAALLAIAIRGGSAGRRRVRR